MSWGAPSAGPVVDTFVAEEFMREIAARCSDSDLTTIADDCGRKSEALAGLLGDGRAASLSRDDLRRVLRWVFASRRKADAILDAVGPTRLGAGIDRLVNGDGGLDDRIGAFDRVLESFPEPAFDLPPELLHFSDPGRYWLWTRWIWDPRIETGALRLVTTDEFELTGLTRGETYLKVGEATAFVAETGRAVGFGAIGRSPFGIDVFLACVYAVYMYTVLRLRMTQEFNKIVPDLPDLVRRLLGVYRLEV